MTKIIPADLDFAVDWLAPRGEMGVAAHFLAEHIAAYRESAAQAERDTISAWLRHTVNEDSLADEVDAGNHHSHSNTTG